MAPTLLGHTLGQRQKFYNELVDKAMQKKHSDIPKINFEDDDVDNLIKIDMACKERNLEYILDVFKCEDMLYVSRAINKSTWLVTDAQYAHIVNPKHLHSELFPQMNAKAVTKLMLHIRRHLKDELRVKAFYKYIYEKNTKAALRWLGNCPLQFIEKTVADRANEIPLKLLRRYCKKSINILSIFLRHLNCCDHLYSSLNAVSDVLNEMKYFLKNKNTTEEFADIVEHCQRTYSYFDFQLNAKYTHRLMKRCPEKIKENFITFWQHIDLTTFVKYMRTDEIRSLLMKSSSIDGWKRWISFATLTPFLDKLPREDILDLLSTLYEIGCHMDPKHSNEKDKSNFEALFYAIENRKYSSYIYVCRWYRFVPFDVSFRDLKKFILAESAPEKRHSMLIILLTCASNDLDHLKTVLQYYHDKHINEPYLHKKTFIDSLLSQHHTFRFDDSMWNTLNALFHSSEVYIESGNDVQASLISIIVRDVLRDQPVHEVAEQKFKVETLKQIKTKLSLEEQDKVFNYLHNLIVKRLNLQSIGSETGMRKAVELLKTLWTLINDWNKVESHHRFVICKTAEICDVNKASSWVQEMKKSCRKRRNKRIRSSDAQPSIDIASIYKMVKTYRKLLFEKSLVFHANEEVLLNALKHDPGLLTRYTSEIDFLRSNDEISLNRFLSKLRIYWPDSLAVEWTDTNTAYLKKLSGHRALMRGILTLLPRNKALDFIKMYAPEENKIQWSETDDIELSIQKHIAKNMHIARPQLPAEVVLWYAKGDYLQYALLSLCTMYYNLRSSDIRKHIALMLDAPVSLQKHGIRLAFVKYNKDEKIDMAAKSWKKTKNSSIRTILFTSMFDLLCLEKKTTTIKAIWLVLRSYMHDLNQEENRRIYETLGKVCEVPLSVVGEFYQKAYLFLKSLPDHVGMYYILESVIGDSEKIIEYLDSEFVEQSLLGSISDTFSQHDSRECCNRTYLEILAAYLLCSKDRQIQMQKFNNLMQPVIDECASKWVNGETYLLQGIQMFLGHICSKISHFVFNKNMTMPIEILSSIRDAILKGSFCEEEQYVMIRRWQLTVQYIEILDEMKKSNEQLSWESIRTASAPHIASMCHNFISEDQRTLFPSIYLLFKDTLKTFFNDFEIRKVNLLKVLYSMLRWKDCPLMYLLVLEMIPAGQGKNFEHWRNEIKKKIYFHPSKEIKMHYFKRFSDKYHEDDEQDDDETEDPDTCSTCSTTSEEDSQNGQNKTPKRNLVQDTYSFIRNPSFFGYRCNIM